MSRLDVPAARISLNHPLRTHGRLGGEEVFIAVRPRQVVDEDPAHWDQGSATFVPASRPGYDLHAASAPSIPCDFQALELQGARDHTGGGGQLLSLDAGPPLAGVLRRRSHQGGSGGELADEGQAPGVSTRQLGPLMGGVVAIGGGGENLVPGANHHHPKKTPPPYS